ncbi:hypothetical protein [Streptomyces albireticuli]
MKAARRKEGRTKNLVLVFKSGPALRVRAEDVATGRRGEWRVR